MLKYLDYQHEKKALGSCAMDSVMNSNRSTLKESEKSADNVSPPLK